MKPRIWVPDSRAGAIEPSAEQAWHGSPDGSPASGDAVAIGTELAKTSQRPEWRDVIGAVTRYFRRLCSTSRRVSLYPPLGDDDDRAGRLAAIAAVAARLDALSSRV